MHVRGQGSCVFPSTAEAAVGAITHLAWAVSPGMDWSLLTCCCCRVCSIHQMHCTHAHTERGTAHTRTCHVALVGYQGTMRRMGVMGDQAASPFIEGLSLHSCIDAFIWSCACLYHRHTKLFVNILVMVVVACLGCAALGWCSPHTPSNLLSPLLYYLRKCRSVRSDALCPPTLLWGLLLLLCKGGQAHLSNHCPVTLNSHYKYVCPSAILRMRKEMIEVS